MTEPKPKPPSPSDQQQRTKPPAEPPQVPRSLPLREVYKGQKPPKKTK